MRRKRKERKKREAHYTTPGNYVPPECYMLGPVVLWWLIIQALAAKGEYGCTHPLHVPITVDRYRIEGREVSEGKGFV